MLMIQHHVEGCPSIEKVDGFQLKRQRQADRLKGIPPEIEIMDIEMSGITVLLIVTAVRKP